MVINGVASKQPVLRYCCYRIDKTDCSSCLLSVVSSREISYGCMECAAFNASISYLLALSPVGSWLEERYIYGQEVCNWAIEVM